MSISRVPMTPEGYKTLQKTLESSHQQLKLVADKIAHAKAFGDLSENAEYKSAKQEQALLMKKLQFLSSRVRNSQVIDPTKLVKTGKVVFGVIVSLLNTDTKEVLKFQIVGEDEADITAGKMSFNTPIARGIMGKAVGEHAQIKTPENIKSFEIQKVEYL